MLTPAPLTNRYSLPILVSLSCWSLPLLAQQQRLGRAASPGRTPTVLARGEKDFVSRCAGCHGLDGRGGERGPNISTTPAVQQLSDHKVVQIVHDGIPEKGMPSFDFLAASEIDSVVQYLRSLGKQPSREILKGNPLRGKELFFGKAECGSCHMMAGKGGFLGSELTTYSETHAADEVREAILNPGRSRDPHQQMVAVVTRSGQRLSGVVRSEDNFSLQLLGVDGTLHLLMKSEVQDVNRSSSPAMPADYGKRLSSMELEDLVSYLAQAAGASQQLTHKGPPGAAVRRSSRKQAESSPD